MSAVAAPDENQSTLKYGDLIFFTTDDDVQGLLHSEGLQNEFMNVEEFARSPPRGSPKNFRNCLFRVSPPLQYFAQAEFETAMAKVPRPGRRMLEHLSQQADKERKFNTAEQAERNGEEVNFGQTVQLQVHPSV